MVTVRYGLCHAYIRVTDRRPIRVRGPDGIPQGAEWTKRVQRHLSHVTRSLKSPVSRLYVQQVVEANKKRNIQVLHYWPFVREIHRWPVDDPHKRPEMRKAFPCHVIKCIDYILKNQTGLAWWESLRIRLLLVVRSCFQYSSAICCSALSTSIYSIRLSWDDNFEIADYVQMIHTS